MTNSQYNAALTIFFVSYSVFEPVTNVLLKRMRPSVFIPIIMAIWVGSIPAQPTLPIVLTVYCLGYLYDMHGSSA